MSHAATNNEWAGLEASLGRRLCNSVEASSGSLWALPSPGVPDEVLRSLVDDKTRRAQQAGLGSGIFSQVMGAIIAQTFSSYPSHVQRVIAMQMLEHAVLSRIASRLPLYAYRLPPSGKSLDNADPPKVQLLYAVVSVLTEQYDQAHVEGWLKMLMGNLVPVIMDAVADWEDLRAEPTDPTDAMSEDLRNLAIINHQVEGRSRTETFDSDDDDDQDLATLLESHLLGLDPLDDDMQHMS